MSENLFKKAFASIEDEYGFNFEELVKIAQESPEKFEEKRAEIMTGYINSLPEEERERYLAFQEKLDERRDPNEDPIISVASALCMSLNNVGNTTESGENVVAISCIKINADAEIISSTTKQIGESGNEIVAANDKIVGGLLETSKAIGEIKEGVTKMQIQEVINETKGYPGKFQH